MLVPRTSVEGILWPALPAPPVAAHLALQFQFGQTQWWKPEDLRHMQFRQLQVLLRHAVGTVPLYRELYGKAGYRPGEALAPESFAALPILHRTVVQTRGQELRSSRVPPGHGKVHPIQTSGSTGKPVKALGTELTQFYWTAFTLRDHFWHRRDFLGRIAAIRTKVKQAEHQNWGAPVSAAFKTGTLATLNIETDLEQQLAWLREQQPDYLISHPSNILGLVKLSRDKGISIPSLREVRTFGEVVQPELRKLCREVWGMKVADMYSAEEIGYMALQCPDHEHYHIQAENVFFEVLDDQGRPCGPGDIGRVVVTTLHNFATPLIRYELLDYAEVGEPCPCGRGLPVIRRVMGRQRNLITYPDGRRNWPSYPPETWAYAAPILQYQLVQKTPQDILVRLVTERPLTDKEEKTITGLLQKRLGYAFTLTLQYLQQIERKANHKYEDFISEIYG